MSKPPNTWLPLSTRCIPMLSVHQAKRTLELKPDFHLCAPRNEATMQSLKKTLACRCPAACKMLGFKSLENWGCAHVLLPRALWEMPMKRTPDPSQRNFAIHCLIVFIHRNTHTHAHIPSLSWLSSLHLFRSSNCAHSHSFKSFQISAGTSR